MALQPLNSESGFSVGKSKTLIINNVGNIEANSLTVNNNSNLGNIGNININGGNNGDVLKTYGNGVLYWDISGSGSNSNYANFAGEAFSVSGSNVTSEVGNANFASYAGNITIASQPNITSVGTLSNLNISGNLSVDTNTLFVDSNNNRVGIGTSTPSYQFTIQNTGSHALLVLDRTDGVGTFIEAQTTRGAFGTIGANPLALSYNSLAVVTIGEGGAITINPDGSNPFTLPTSDGSNGQTLITNGTGNVTFGIPINSSTVTSSSQPNITSVGTLTQLSVNGTSNLGSNSNVKITGGSNNQILVTDGNGNLSWANVSIPSAIEYGEVVQSSNIAISVGSSSSSTTLITFTIPSAGTWRITYIMHGYGGGTSGGTYALYDSNGNLISNSEIRGIYTNTGLIASEVTGVMIVTTTGSTTYTIRGWAQTGASNSLSYSDGRSKVVYEKIGGILANGIVNGNSNVTVTQNGNVTFGVGGNANILIITNDGVIASNINITGKSNIGNISNIIITGGSNGQTIITDGNGNLSWYDMMSISRGIVNAGIDVTLNNIKARIPTSGNRSLQLSTNSGNYTIIGSGQNILYNGTITAKSIDSGNAIVVTTSPTYIDSTHNLTTSGETSLWTIMDSGNNIAWRVSLIIGASYNNNMISIERLI